MFVYVHVILTLALSVSCGELYVVVENKGFVNYSFHVRKGVPPRTSKDGCDTPPAACPNDVHNVYQKVGAQSNR